MENKIEKTGSSKIKVILLGILILAVVGGGAYFGYNKLLKNGKSNTTQNTIPQANVQQTANQTQSQSGSASFLSQVVSAKTFELDEITVNLADKGSSRYLKAAVSLGYDDKKLDSELNDKKPIVTDAVIGILSSKKAEEITPKNMDNIKMEIIQKINPMLEKGKLNNVYFTDLIVQ
ncbi:MAG: flagellar basal body-associated FliL family protein [Clostridium sp.]|uniref:flagellar basal body-associated FliL family protein n=1 Tax=Clostridium sp. TaxID=1506 RepID=UPI0025B8600D|nr:flagellar basal body-associated FliL family protein [Clostridium sp.]MCH3964216.1 flagellar basal body-associated FliL family protein [Clostridium sp.]MCI1715397.1 flagellar basal body-associated FliL family protein [Clostridium sp.]MCI1799812.1 flagellar basal body-associated FliL family protein [Clostridium sp.]MCI1813580.1 flagellar basal body-associated FliL family protein [Clostridium sp.]MCI1870630.1 flagellar basal body-associated FliL family protein [Clostridium sp.]